MTDKTIHFLIKTFWPNKFLSQKRQTIMNSLFRITTDDRLHTHNNSVLIEPWAFIRVCNEINTLSPSLNSIIPLFKKGVIGYNSCTDGSEEVILDFCKKNPGFIPAKYSHKIYQPSIGEKVLNVPYENTLAAYYNFVLSFIPKNEWLMKIDVDHFYFQDIIKHSFTLPKSKKEIVVYSRLNLVRKDKDIRVISYSRPGDQWLIYNNNITFKNIITNDGKRYVERLQTKGISVKYRPECSNFHFPFEKTSRKFDNVEFHELESFENYMKKADPLEFSDKLRELKTAYNILDQFDKINN